MCIKANKLALRKQAHQKFDRKFAIIRVLKTSCKKYMIHVETAYFDKPTEAYFSRL